MATTGLPTARTGRHLAVLRDAPATVPAIVAMALFVVWAGGEAGYPVTHWGPGGLILLALLAIALVFVGAPWLEMPVTVRIALAGLTGYTVLSFLSVLWAAVPADAWEGANRTLLYLLVFALFACWPQRGPSAALLLGGWTLAMAGLAAFVAVHLDVASDASLQTLVPTGRLEYPAGYANAAAAQWLMAFWPALLLARSEHLPWALRGLLAGGAVLLAGVALLSQSRGSVYATPVMLVIVFAFLPGRVRTFAVLVPVAAGIAAAAPFVLRVGDHLRGGEVVASTTHSAIAATFFAAVAVALVVALGAAVESRTKLSRDARQRVHRGLAATGVITLVLVLGAGLALAGNPVSRLRHAWDTFKGGYVANSTTGSRLVSGLGSNRYDFYRVALDEFVAHPVLGIGADNFQEAYLVHGRSSETPHYPHSVELRTLVETGLIGACLAAVGLAAALLAGDRAILSRDRLSGYVAAAALAGFAYWLVHGSFDWFWEFAGLGAPAFALLGLACSLTPRLSARSPRAAAGGPPWRRAQATASAWQKRWRNRRWLGSLGVAIAALAALAAAVSLAAPWLSRLQVESAARIWRGAPQTAYDRLNDAARMNPLSDEPYLVAGNIALRYDDLARAGREFSLALSRTPDDAYATLELGAIESARGRRVSALSLLARALRLNPRDPITQEALAAVRMGRRVNIDELNQLVLLKAQQFA